MIYHKSLRGIGKELGGLTVGGNESGKKEIKRETEL